MKKMLNLALATVLCVLLLAACGGNGGSSSATPSSSTPGGTSAPSGLDPFAGVDEAPFIAAGEKALDLFHAGDYETLTTMFRSDLSSTIGETDWVEQADLIYAQTGDYVKQAGAEAIMTTDPSLGDVVAVLVTCEYAEMNLTWQAVFDLDMQMLGLVVVG